MLWLVETDAIKTICFDFSSNIFYLYYFKVTDLIKKVDIIRLDGAYC